MRHAPMILPVLAIALLPLVVLRAWLGSVLYLHEKLVLALYIKKHPFSTPGHAHTKECDVYH